MNYIEQLRKRAEKVGNIVCVGLDPVLEKIPSEGCEEFVNKKSEPGKAIAKFYVTMLEGFVKEGVIPAIVKPNIAFYEQYGFEGLKALKEIMDKCKELEIPVLLDAKRGDIGKTSKAYAKALFEVWKADAITIAPYMGADSVGPFTKYCDNYSGENVENGKGVYILCRTSNNGAVDLQNLKTEDGTTIYMKTAEKLAGDWYKLGIGAVVGATYIKELEQISKFFVDSGKEIPLLIPGVGAQGGSAKEVVEALKNTGNELALHRINSSSGINFAYLKQGTDDYVGAAVNALKELINELNQGQ
ncbi:orotidine-5'-phosphate decarboxylase [Candidatus Woesearchaeota archaeon]|jgi:orotidine-5'-phosphate decarboxylase|nr:orotidine-5'-phosphate decarboxylase [Candidatus Woesearchaeota archaeon]MBT5271890.1 orotidine-5'-phosphate decarboxylase [Candidatus Woesearchaeota archaeon]MBT6040703.1 orotidine-5'-phosphate decarboxylase [Candidatus Woesearchaeota archaeon]MBT6336178.1 orotidine-5'-phosphate decarboxylase [Candidatus Woesearchaeota archaeon]MBT7928055.1 orotidine-5'-phosphate decarboxylase [Candidatus Woesearchaeota archaeon]